MRSFNRATSAVAGLLAILVTASVSLADVVKYYTEGEFSVGGGVTTISVGGNTINFYGAGSIGSPEATSDIAPGSSANALFGNFEIINSSYEFKPTDLGTFELRLYQVEPSDGGATFVGAFTGTFGTSSAGSDLQLTLVPNFTVIPPVSPAVHAITYTFNTPTNVPGAISGKIAVAPLPPAVLAGGALMGCVGLYRRYRAAKVA